VTVLGRPRSKALAAGGAVATGLALAAAAGALPALGPGFVRSCATQPSGVSVPSGFRVSSATVAPLSLYSFGGLRSNGRRSTVSASRFRAVEGDRYRVYKLWALLPPGRGAILSVPAGERGVVSLAYDPALWNRAGWDGTARVGQGDASVAFHGCPRSRAQGRPPLVVYDGGLIAAGPRCARLRVDPQGPARARTIVIALGRRRC
jgi:hypothetical protein